MKISATPLFLFAMVVAAGKIDMREVSAEDYFYSENPKQIAVEDETIDFGSKDSVYPINPKDREMIRIQLAPAEPKEPKYRDPVPPANNVVSSFGRFVLNLIVQILGKGKITLPVICESTKALESLNMELAPKNSRRAAALQKVEVTKLPAPQKDRYRRELLDLIGNNPIAKQIVDAVLGKGKLPSGIPLNDAKRWVDEAIMFNQIIKKKDLSSILAALAQFGGNPPRGIAVGEFYPMEADTKGMREQEAISQ